MLFKRSLTKNGDTYQITIPKPFIDNLKQLGYAIEDVEVDVKILNEKKIQITVPNKYRLRNINEFTK